MPSEGPPAKGLDLSARSPLPPSVSEKASAGQPLVYVLVTPARNEAAFIEQTIKSMIAQTVLPLKWVIVSDGSTDGTDDLVKRYAADHDWIELIRMPERQERHFAGKVNAFNIGWNHVRGLKYQFIGNLDGDLSFDNDLFAFLLGKLSEDSKLGLVGAPFKEDGFVYDFRFASVDHVSGALQLFRRECFEKIGGYVPVKGGGIDVIAVWSARASGWQTRTFTEKFYYHHRKMGTAKDGVLRVKFKDGQKDYSLGGHPLWEIFRVLYQMTKSPLIIGGCALGLGYLWSLLQRVERPMSPELVQFRRAHQMRRLKAQLLGR